MTREHGSVLRLALRWVLVVATLAAGAARAGDDVETSARRLMRDLRFPDAAAAIERAVTSGGASRDRLVNLYLLWAESEASMGHEDFAAQLYGRALELSPTYLLPPNSAPKIRRPYERARAQLAGQALDADLRSDWLSDGRARTQLRVTGDTLKLARSAKLLAPEYQTIEFSQLPAAEAIWRCAAPPCGYSVRLFDEYGNTLRGFGDSGTTMVLDAPVAPRAAEVKRAKWIWTGAAAVLGIATGLFAWQFARTQASLVQAATVDRGATTLAQVESLDRARRAFQVGTMASAALCVGAGTAAVVTW